MTPLNQRAICWGHRKQGLLSLLLYSNTLHVLHYNPFFFLTWIAHLQTVVLIRVDSGWVLFSSAMSLRFEPQQEMLSPSSVRVEPLRLCSQAKMWIIWHAVESDGPVCSGLTEGLWHESVIGTVLRIEQRLRKDSVWRDYFFLKGQTVCWPPSAKEDVNSEWMCHFVCILRVS